MEVYGFVNIYFDGKHCWSGSDVYPDLSSAKRVGFTLAKGNVRCLGQRRLEFDTDTFVSDTERETIIENTDITRRTCKPRRRPSKVQSTGESDT